MWIIIDRKIPVEAKKNLVAYGELMELTTSGITYPAISGHPDIFFCQMDNQLVVAPNLPAEYRHKLDLAGKIYTVGQLEVGTNYPDSAHYNAVFSSPLMIHNLNLTDPAILCKVDGSDRVHISQGYCRCNLIPLRDHAFITSDPGIYKTLSGRGFHILFTDPAGIVLPGFPNGFIGGTCGIFGDTVFFTGSLQHCKHGNTILRFLQNLDYKVVELSRGPLFDGGGILFI
jgi:hypothetical protein